MNNRERRLFENWWLLLIKGFIISLFGIIYLINYYISHYLQFLWLNFRYLILIFLIVITLDGMLILFGSFFYRKNNSHWLFWFIEGIFDLLLSGIAFTLLLTEHTSYLFINLVFLYILSFWALIHGIIHSASALKLKQYVPQSKYALFCGIAVVILSTLVLIRPVFPIQLHDKILIGSFTLIIGILLSLISILLRRIYSH